MRDQPIFLVIQSVQLRNPQPFVFFEKIIELQNQIQILIVIKLLLNRTVYLNQYMASLAIVHYDEQKSDISKLFLQILSYHKNLLQLADIGLLRQSNTGCATDDNNRNFSRVSPTEIFSFFSLVDVVSGPLTEENIQNFTRRSPTQISLF